MYSDEDILDYIRLCYETYDEVNTKRFKNDDDLCSLMTVLNHFGSINKAIEKSDINIDYKCNGCGKELDDNKSFSYHKGRCRWTKEKRERAIDLYKNGKNAREVSDEFGSIDENSVGKMLEFNNIEKKTKSEASSLDVNHDKFNQIRQYPNKIYWLGFFLADGSISQHPSGKYRIRMGLGIEDIDHILKWKRFMNAEHKVRISNKASNSGNTSVHFEFASDKVGEKFIDLGIIMNKSQGHDIRKPFLLNNRNFWRGVIDGDGCLSIIRKDQKTENVVVSLSGKKNLLHKFKDFLGENYGLYSGANVYHKQGSTYQVSIPGRIALESMDVLYNNSQAYLQRKYDKYNEIINRFDGYNGYSKTCG